MPQTVGSGPTRKVLLALVLLALVLHAAVLLGLESPLSVRLRADPAPGTVHVRMVTPPAPEPVRRPVPRPKIVKPAPAAPAPAPAKAETVEVAKAPQAEPEPQAQTPLQPQRPAVPDPVQDVSAATASAPAVEAQPPAVPPGTAWPLVPLGALPPSALLQYQLTGMDKGFTYYASGELRWQHNATDYELTLAIRAFLVGRRQWRSVGRIEATGLAPTRFSDSWRQERAAHFDREQQRIVFSSNSNPAVLEPGAQDQISLYVQLAAAVAGEPERFAPGARLQVQTATVRDALPWSLVMEGQEDLVLDGQSVKASKWVCQPRNRYEARVEFWVTPAQAWLPVRIRITQTSGSFIDLLWRGTEPLPPLPQQGDAQSRAARS